MKYSTVVVEVAVVLQILKEAELVVKIEVLKGAEVSVMGRFSTKYGLSGEWIQFQLKRERVISERWTLSLQHTKQVHKSKGKNNKIHNGYLNSKFTVT